MKKSLIIIVLITFLGCGREDNLTGSNIDIDKPKLTELDKWLRNNYSTPYNIDVLYKWNENMVDQNRYLHPPKLESIKPAVEAIKTIWLDSYNEVGGKDFVKKIAPREILLVGGLNLNKSGRTTTLGFAEGGKRIVFFEVDLIDYTSKESLLRFISTIQHEYCHILNQNVVYDKESYGKITPSNYTSDWFNESIKDSRELGYITSYARLNVDEDIAEMVNTMLSNSNESWNELIDEIENESAKKAIRRKEALIVRYYKESLNIDFYKLQEVANKNLKKIIN